MTEIRTPLTDEQRKAVVKEAFTWVGTRYHHAADVKGHGVDCAMILVKIYCGLNIAPKFDPRPYPAQWYLHRDEERYLAWVQKYCDKVETALPGDIAMYKYGRCTAHGAIIVDNDYMIHAYEPVGQVEYVERRAFLDRFHSIWSPRNLS